jgi:hypothetical protein
MKGVLGMGIREQLTPEQWKALVNTPGAAATFVATASGGGLEVFKEVFSASKFTAEIAGKSGGSDYGSLVDDLIAAMKGMTFEEAKANAIQYQSQNPADIRAEMKRLVAEGVAVIAGLPGADGFKKWLVDMAREVAGTKTGGVLGIGGQSIIDEQEQAAIAELTAMMDL